MQPVTQSCLLGCCCLQAFFAFFQHQRFYFIHIGRSDLPDFFVFEFVVDCFKQVKVDKWCDFAALILGFFLTIETEEGLVAEPHFSVLFFDNFHALVGGVSLQKLKEHAAGGLSWEEPFAGEYLNQIISIIFEDGGDEVYAALDSVFVEGKQVWSCLLYTSLHQ